MSDLPVNPLADIIRKAAERKVEGPMAKLKKRHTDASNEMVIVCDVSSSMHDIVGRRTKIDHLRIALKDALKYYPKIKLIEFSSIATVVKKPEDISSPIANTAMHKGLELAATFRPKKTIVISDGCPDSESLALEAADNMTGSIDVIYIGPEGLTEAVAFMQKLARDTGGVQVTWDLANERLILGQQIQRMIEAPKS